VALLAGSDTQHKFRKPKNRVVLRASELNVIYCIYSHGKSHVRDTRWGVAALQAPKAAENFLALCASGYYDGTIFHRNIKGFMIQVPAWNVCVLCTRNETCNKAAYLQAFTLTPCMRMRHCFFFNMHMVNNITHGSILSYPFCHISLVFSKIPIWVSHRVEIQLAQARVAKAYILHQTANFLTRLLMLSNTPSVALCPWQTVDQTQMAVNSSSHTTSTLI